MKLSNFEMVKEIGSSPTSWEYFATVDVETGHLWWKKTENRTIHREYATSWHFVDNGEYTPDVQADYLEKAYLAQKTLADNP